jgi:GxxExxY protein
MKTDQTQINALTYGETTSRIIGAAFEVHNILGYGFLEKVYQRAMVELIKRGSSAETKTSVQVLYKNAVVGEYYADLFVDACVIGRDQSSEVLPRSRRGAASESAESHGYESRGAC